MSKGIMTKHSGVPVVYSVIRNAGITYRSGPDNNYSVI